MEPTGEHLSFSEKRTIARAHIYRTLRQYIPPFEVPRTSEGIVAVLSITERTSVEEAKSVKDFLERSQLRGVVKYPAFYQLAQVYNSDMQEDFLTLEDAAGGYEVTPGAYGLLVVRNFVPELMGPDIQKGVTALQPGGYAISTTDSADTQVKLADALTQQGFTLLHNERNQSRVEGIDYKDTFVVVGKKS